MNWPRPFQADTHNFPGSFLHYPPAWAGEKFLRHPLRISDSCTYAPKGGDTVTDCVAHRQRGAAAGKLNKCVVVGDLTWGAVGRCLCHLWLFIMKSLVLFYIILVSYYIISFCTHNPEPNPRFNLMCSITIGDNDKRLTLSSTCVNQTLT